MADYKATKVSAPAHHQAFGNLVGGFDEVTPPVALALNDTVDLVRIPGGTLLTDLEKWNGDFDTGATLQYKIGYRSADGGSNAINTNDSYFGSALTDLQAAVTSGTRTRYTFAPIRFNEDVIVFATVTAAATGVSGTPKLSTLFRGLMEGIK